MSQKNSDLNAVNFTLQRQQVNYQHVTGTQKFIKAWLVAIQFHDLLNCATPREK